MGWTIAICISIRMGARAPISAQVTSGTVAKPSRLEEGWILGRAVRKSGRVIERGSSWAEVSFVG